MTRQDELRLATEANLRDNAALQKLYNAMREPDFPSQREETQNTYFKTARILEQALMRRYAEQDYNDALDDGLGLLATVPYRNVVQLDEGLWGRVKRIFSRRKA